MGCANLIAIDVAPVSASMAIEALAQIDVAATHQGFDPRGQDDLPG
jgi:hypothetical protein